MIVYRKNKLLAQEHFAAEEFIGAMLIMDFSKDADGKTSLEVKVYKDDDDGDGWVRCFEVHKTSGYFLNTQEDYEVLVEEGEVLFNYLSRFYAQNNGRSESRYDLPYNDADFI